MKKFNYKAKMLLKIRQVEKIKSAQTLAEKGAHLRSLEVRLGEAEQNIVTAGMSRYGETTIELSRIEKLEVFRQAEREKAFRLKGSVSAAATELLTAQQDYIKEKRREDQILDDQAEKKHEFEKEQQKMIEQQSSDRQAQRLARSRKQGLGILVLMLMGGMPCMVSATASEIAARKAELDSRALELQAREIKIKEQEELLARREKVLEEMMGQIEQRLKSKVQEDDARLNSQVKMISEMKPSNAANVLAGMNEELALAIMKRIKPSQLSQLLNNLKDRDAVRLNELLAGYRKPSPNTIQREGATQ